MCDHPPNFRLLPSFTHQILDADGVFLNPVSGLHYVLHLFDATEAALQSAFLGTDQSLLVIRETVRQSNDRVSYLENKHIKLQCQVDLKAATDAEISDWLLNRAEEDWLTVAGLPRLSGANWQDAARRQVADTIKLVLHTNRANVPFEVMYVSNPFCFQTNRQNFYNVRMDSAHSSSRIREIFSSFFRRNRPISRPPALKDVSIRNKITPDTKIRISILHQFGAIYQVATRGASYKVTGHDSRPLLVTLPAHGSTERQRTYTFMQAVTLLPANFSDDHLTRIFQVVSNQQPGKLKSLFVVINDDQRERCLELVKQKRAAAGSRGPAGPSPASASFSGGASGVGSGMDLSGAGVHHTVSFSGAVSAPGSGESLESAQVTLSDLSQPPPPPPVSKKPSSHSRSQPEVPEVRSREGSVDSRVSRRSSGHTSKTKVRTRDVSRDRDSQDSDRGKEKDSKRRRSPSSSSERDRKRKKKSKTRRRSPSSSSSSSTSGSGSGSGSDTSHSARKSRKSKKKSKKSGHKTRER